MGAVNKWADLVAVIAALSLALCSQDSAQPLLLKGRDRSDDGRG